MVNDRTFEDAMHTTLEGTPMPVSSNVGSPCCVAPDFEPARWRKIQRNLLIVAVQNASKSKNASRRFPRLWPLTRLRLQVLSK